MLCLGGRGTPSAGECVYCGAKCVGVKTVGMILEAHHKASKTDVG